MNSISMRSTPGFLLFTFMIILSGDSCRASDPVVIRSAEDLASCHPSQLELLFSQGYVSAIPTGSVWGIPLVNPGQPQARVASRAGRLVWSGKRLDPVEPVATNVFFGIPSVKAQVRVEPSRRDGQPVIVLDYTSNAVVYRNKRDEIREISPGIFLGYMYDVRSGDAAILRWFAFETRP